MAAALTGAGLIRLQKAIEAKTTEKFTGIVLDAGMALSVFQESGASGAGIFSAFILEISDTTGVLNEQVVTCESADVSWTDIYTAPAGTAAFVTLVVLNIDVSPISYSFGIRGATEIEGETPGA